MEKLKDYFAEADLDAQVEFEFDRFLLFLGSGKYYKYRQNVVLEATPYDKDPDEEKYKNLYNTLKEHLEKEEEQEIDDTGAESALGGSSYPNKIHFYSRTESSRSNIVILLHEAAHNLLGHNDPNAPFIPKLTQDIQAEGFALIVARILGVQNIEPVCAETIVRYFAGGHTDEARDTLLQEKNTIVKLAKDFCGKL